VVPSVRFECRNPNLSENHGDHPNPQLHHPVGHDRQIVDMHEVASAIPKIPSTENVLLYVRVNALIWHGASDSVGRDGWSRQPLRIAALGPCRISLGLLFFARSCLMAVLEGFLFLEFCL